MPPSNVDVGRLAPVVVAVDGPSGSGKSSVSRRVAADLGLRYLDTGAMYRAVTWWMLEHAVDVNDPDGVAALAGAPAVLIGTDPDKPTISVDGVDASAPIRSDQVTAAVSAVSAVPAVRARMAALQREAIGPGGIVVEGRDIGTVVAPDADVKVFLTASEDARAVRRAAEHSATDQGDVPGVDLTRASLRRRDALDSSRPTSPLRKADDAVEIDATDLTLDEVVAAVITLVVAHAASTTDGVQVRADVRPDKDTVTQ